MTRNHYPSKLEKKILEFLQKHNRRFSSADISEQTGIDRTNIPKLLNNLYRAGYIARYPGPRRGFSYKLVTDNPEEVKPPRSKKDKPLPQPENSIQITGSSFLSLITPWSKEKWHPHIFDSAPNFPVGLAKLLELTHETVFGSQVKQEHLDKVRYDINEFRTDLLKTLSVVDAILKTPELWNPTTFNIFIMQTGHDPEYYRRLAQDIKDKN